MGSVQSKEKIIAAVTDMLNEGIGAEGLTTREIAKRAGVGIGLINYHFQTKDNLIDAAVGRFIGTLTESLGDTLRSTEGTAKQRLKALARQTLDALAQNPCVGRLAVSRGMESEQDAFMGAVQEVCRPLIAEITGEDPYWTQLIGSLILYNFEGSFLRAEKLKQTAEFDFYSSDQRGRYSDDIIETVLHDLI